jgi:hypothetical protein
LKEINQFKFRSPVSLQAFFCFDEKVLPSKQLTQEVLAFCMVIWVSTLMSRQFVLQVANFDPYDDPKTPRI